eukprot:m.319050 g.319050  ORF g.319050 m.319050 type:complete len:342 (-) comp19701_c2_seq6:113-1138(-)
MHIIHAQTLTRAQARDGKEEHCAFQTGRAGRGCCHFRHGNGCRDYFFKLVDGTMLFNATALLLVWLFNTTSAGLLASRDATPSTCSISTQQHALQRFEWPTNEMESRGNATGLLMGLAFAIPAGAGVALSITSVGAINSLVGVAIAASLVPPVVNAGMMLCFAWFGPAVVDGDFKAQHFYDICGFSIGIFLINVLVIYVVALGFFRLKRIAPMRFRSNLYVDMPALLSPRRPHPSRAQHNWDRARDVSLRRMEAPESLHYTLPPLDSPHLPRIPHISVMSPSRRGPLDFASQEELETVTLQQQQQRQREHLAASAAAAAAASPLGFNPFAPEPSAREESAA